MTKYERVVAAIEGREVDMIPCSFSLHFPHDSAFGEASVKAHLDFFKKTDTDIINGLSPEEAAKRAAEAKKEK